jgi:hypothetical protein
VKQGGREDPASVRLVLEDAPGLKTESRAVNKSVRRSVGEKKVLPFTKSFLLFKNEI